MKAAAEYQCSCGHQLAEHETPGGNAVPWGRCSHRDPSGTIWSPSTPCQCREAWPMEDPS